MYEEKDSFVTIIMNQLDDYYDTLSIRDIASILGINKETVRRMVARDEIKSESYGRERIIAKSWFIEFICTTDKRFIPFSHIIKVRQDAVVEYCAQPRNWHNLLEFTGYCNKSHLQKYITRPLLDEGRLKLTLPDRPHHNGQMYIDSDKTFR